MDTVRTDSNILRLDHEGAPIVDPSIHILQRSPFQKRANVSGPLFAWEEALRDSLSDQEDSFWHELQFVGRLQQRFEVLAEGRHRAWGPLMSFL
jgi:hypothetical protein